MREFVSTLRKIFSDRADIFWKKVVGLYAFLIAFNVAAWACAVFTFGGNAVLLGAAMLAYTFGLRHAFDADHIAAIDTATRKLMQRDARPTTVGFHFSIGHSLALLAIVGVIAALGAWTVGAGRLSFLRSLTSVASTFVSATFLIVMAVLNLNIARSTYLVFRQVRRGGVFVEEDFNVLLNKRGFFSRILRPLFRLITKSWHMAPIGFLFGLGFDTATEIGLLSIAGVEAARGLPIWTILVFPALFAAGMSLMDSTDSVLMAGAYGWALRNPLRKIYYNLTVTIVSATVALIVAGIEVFALTSEQFSIKGGFWSLIDSLSDNWGVLGIFIVSLFVVIWLFSAIVSRLNGCDKMEISVVPARDIDA